MTFSILGCDAERRAVGSAVASRSVAVGGTVAYSRFGVGIVITQHHAHLSTGQHVLDRMERGRHPREALVAELEDREGSAIRQLIAANAEGAMGAWTGGECDGECGHRLSRTCVAAGNMLASTKVIDRMIETFEDSDDQSLEERLLRSLEAGERAGGDRRGRQAAAVFVLPSPDRRTAVNLDLRVDDHADPIRELRRLQAIFEREFR